MTLRAVVIGAGWAGEGHTKALQYCGVEVEAICARQASVVQAVADRLGVPTASTDWRQTLAMVRPHIVALATPASLRGEVVEVATSQGSHILCDKPLALNAGEAKRLYGLADRAGVKHAYAATFLYDPSIAWLAELIQNGDIGDLREVEVSLRTPIIGERSPWGWVDRLDTGGGALNNVLPHFLAMLERILGSRVASATGEARVLRRRAPVVEGFHDFRQLANMTPSAEDTARLAWRECDADGAFSTLMRFVAPTVGATAVQVCIVLNIGAHESASATNWRFYGSTGTLVGEGFFSLTVYQQTGSERAPLPVPSRLVNAVSQIGDTTLNHWTALAQDFVADIRGEPHEPYLTFNDGWRYQEAIDAIRAGHGWSDLPRVSSG